MQPFSKEETIKELAKLYWDFDIDSAELHEKRKVLPSYREGLMSRWFFY